MYSRYIQTEITEIESIEKKTSLNFQTRVQNPSQNFLIQLADTMLSQEVTLFCELSVCAFMYLWNVVKTTYM